MKFDHFFQDREDTLVEKKKKATTFTIREIGGPAEIIKWREMQAAKESIYRMRLENRDMRLDDFEKKTGQKLDRPTIHTSSWAEKQAFAQSERKRLAALEKIASEPWEPIEAPQLSVVQRIIRFFKKLWLSANF